MREFSRPQRALFWLAGTLASRLIALYYLTVRIRNHTSAQTALNGQAIAGVYAFWHSHQLSAVWHLRGRGAGIIISASKDGEYIARVASAFGFVPVRGSSSRQGASALRGIIRLIDSGHPVGITPDGPRGPRYSVNPGALAAARSTGRPVTPFAIGLSRFWEVRSWDRFRIPKPFSRGVFMLGEPLHVPADADQQAMQRLADELRERMIRLEQMADEAARR